MHGDFDALSDAPARSPAPDTRWQPPTFEVISLSCEITSYAPDDEPLF
jgi:hypothetical protein